MTEVDHGPAGGVRHVLRSFSPSDARLMIYTAKRITGAELYRMNVAPVCAPRAQVLEEATAIGRTIAQKVPLAVVAAKRSFGLTEEMPLRDGSGGAAIQRRQEPARRSGLPRRCAPRSDDRFIPSPGGRG